MQKEFIMISCLLWNHMGITSSLFSLFDNFVLKDCPFSWTIFFKIVSTAITRRKIEMSNEDIQKAING